MSTKIRQDETTTSKKESKMSKPNLEHAEGCKMTRPIEATKFPERRLTTHHCLECGAHVAIRDDGSIKPTPVTPGPFNHDEPIDHESDLMQATEGGTR